MDFKYHLETAWKLTLQHIAPLIFMTLAMIVISFITLGILGPVAVAGYMHSILLLIREGREPKIQDIFSHMRLFFPLLLFGIVIFIITLIGIMLLFLPGVLFVLAISFCCIYMLPLMTDRNLGLIDASLRIPRPGCCPNSLSGDVPSGFIFLSDVSLRKGEGILEPGIHFENRLPPPVGEPLGGGLRQAYGGCAGKA